MKFFKNNTIYLLIFVFLASCGGFKKVDSRNIPVNAQERARKNVDEGRGISLKGLTGRRGNTSYEFSTSNPMWRSSLEVLDFLPLTTVDYSGGIIITDWYNDTLNSNDSIKITVRFLSNEVAANSLDIIIHKKNCNINSNCLVNKIDSKIEEELKKTIIRKAALLDAELKKRK